MLGYLMQRTIASVVWNKKAEKLDQWSLVADYEKEVVTCYHLTESGDPLRIYAWSLLHADRYVDFLQAILQKFHQSRASSLVEVRLAIIATQNEFAKALTKDADA